MALLVYFNLHIDLYSTKSSYQRKEKKEEKYLPRQKIEEEKLTQKCDFNIQNYQNPLKIQQTFYKKKKPLLKLRFQMRIKGRFLNKNTGLIQLSKDIVVYTRITRYTQVVC